MPQKAAKTALSAASIFIIGEKRLSLLARMHNHFKFAVGAFGFFLGSLNTFVGGENHSHAAMTLNLGFAKDAHLRSGFFEHFLDAGKFHCVGVAFNHHGARSRRSIKLDFRYRQSKQGAGMQCKFALVLRNHSHHAGVVATLR